MLDESNVHIKSIRSSPGLSQLHTKYLTTLIEEKKIANFGSKQQCAAQN